MLHQLIDMKVIKINKNIKIKHNNGDILECKEMPVTHEFADQIYLRKMTMEKGLIVQGAEHKHTHVWFLLEGRVTIKESGETIEHIAPCYTVSKPGAQRVIFAHEKSVFINIHKNPDNTKNIKELEKQIVELCHL
jgi:quercetin dioxygenase-like cupin family protein